MTPYQNHATMNHTTSRYSPNGIQIIEECSQCGMRFLHDPCFGYPITMRTYPPLKWNSVSTS